MELTTTPQRTIPVTPSKTRNRKGRSTRITGGEFTALDLLCFVLARSSNNKSWITKGKKEKRGEKTSGTSSPLILEDQQ
jgi:hypothetical protein